MSNPTFDSLRFMRKYILQLLLFSVPLFSITIILQALIFFAQTAGYSSARNLLHMISIIDLMVLPFLSGGLLILVASLSDGKSLSMRTILQKVSLFWFYYILLAIGLGFAIALGLVLYLIPGIWLFFKFIFAQPILVFEAKAPADALVSSYQRSSASMLKLSSIILPPMIVVLSIYVYMFYLAGFRIEALQLVVPLKVPMLYQIALPLFSLGVLLFSNILQYRLYQLYGQPSTEVNKPD